MADMAAVKEIARDMIVDTISSFPVNGLSDSEVLDILNAMRDEVGVAIKLYTTLTS